MAKYWPREGWWFSAEMKLPYGDDRPIVIGERLGIKGKLVICQNALHGSFDPFDALQYAPGGLLHKCLFSGARIEENDKIGSRYRIVLASRDATTMLRQFAREQALSVIHLWDAPAIVREYLETGDENKRAAALAAAWAAARDDARAAARAAAWAARAAAWADARADARADAWAAAWADARTDAWAAAWSARDAARAAAWADARDDAWADAWAAAWADARTDAWAAARADARKRFNELVAELFATENA